MRENGLDVKAVNDRNPTAIMPMTASTRARKAWGNGPDRATTATIQPVSIRIQSSSEPSWPPHTALRR